MSKYTRRIRAALLITNRTKFGKKLISLGIKLHSKVTFLPEELTNSLVGLHQSGALDEAISSSYWLQQLRFSNKKIKGSISIASLTMDTKSFNFIYEKAQKKGLSEKFQILQALLQSDEEIKKNNPELIKRIKKDLDFISRVAISDKIDSVLGEVFTYQNASPRDPEVRAYARRYIDSALNKRINNFQGRAGFFDKHIAYEILLELSDIFKKNNRVFFLVSGTLLGAIRNKDFVASDYDIDLGVIEEETSAQDIIDILQDSSEFTVSKKLSTPERVTVTHSSSLEVEFFVHQKEGGYFVLHTDIHSWYYTPFKLKKMSFKDNDFYIPDDAEQYLRENYGNWETPAAYFDFSFDTPNRVYRDNIHGLLYLTQRLHNGYKYGWPSNMGPASKFLNDYFAIDYTMHMPSKKGLASLEPVTTRIEAYKDLRAKKENLEEDDEKH